MEIHVLLKQYYTQHEHARTQTWGRISMHSRDNNKISLTYKHCPIRNYRNNYYYLFHYLIFNLYN